MMQYSRKMNFWKWTDYLLVFPRLLLIKYLFWSESLLGTRAHRRYRSCKEIWNQITSDIRLVMLVLVMLVCECSMGMVLYILHEMFSVSLAFGIYSVLREPWYMFAVLLTLVHVAFCSYDIFFSFLYRSYGIVLFVSDVNTIPENKIVRMPKSDILYMMNILE